LKENINEWTKLLNMNTNDKGLTLRDLADTAMEAGDSVMYRIWSHVKNDNGRIDEQIDRNNGAQKSAKGLTWSHANILHAMHTRNQVSKKNTLIHAEDN